jgi:hypothetical protein
VKTKNHAQIPFIGELQENSSHMHDNSIWGGGEMVLRIEQASVVVTLWLNGYHDIFHVLLSLSDRTLQLQQQLHFDGQLSLLASS